MKNSFKLPVKIACGILSVFCLTTISGCAYGQSPQGTTKPLSEVISVETVSDPMPANIALGDGWCYLRYNLTREQLEALADTTPEDSSEVISLSLPNCTPDDNPFYINITPDDITQSLRLLDQHPEQMSINLIKELPTDAIENLEKPNKNLHYVYYLLTEGDVIRMIDGLETAGSDTIFLRQRLNITSDDIAEFSLQLSMLYKCLEILQTTDQPYVVYITQVEAPEVI